MSVCRGGEAEEVQILFSFKLAIGLVAILAPLYIAGLVGAFLGKSWIIYPLLCVSAIGGSWIASHAFASLKNKRIDVHVLMLIALVATLSVSPDCFLFLLCCLSKNSRFD